MLAFNKLFFFLLKLPFPFLDFTILFLYLAVIFTFSLDQNYGIMNYVSIVPNFFKIENYALYMYISGLIFFLEIFNF